MSEPWVSVLLRRGTVYVTAAYSPGPGTYVDQEPVLAVHGPDPLQVGLAVLSGLRHFTDGGHMPDWSVYLSPLLAAADVKTWDELEQESIGCAVELSAKGFTVLAEIGPQRLEPSAEPAELGRAVLRALKAE
jgi:hypothetical protein